VSTLALFVVGLLVVYALGWVYITLDEWHRQRRHWVRHSRGRG
jgi:uncharacterized protein HemY